MKKLLFSLAAAATCGVAAAAPATATFDGLTAFNPAIEENGRYYWEIDTSSDPELVVSENEVALDYLKINTGSTPLWRTFEGTDARDNVTNAGLQATPTNANGVVVSSDVKLTACTEFPKLTDFEDEKLALFLFAKEEGDTSGKDSGLYAVGGAMVDNVLTAKAYKLDIDVDNVTNAQGWATIAIKSYDNIISEGDGVAAFVIAVNGNIVAVDTEEEDYTGFSTKPLFNAAATRLGDKQLIPAAIAGATLQGLGFQGEGGIDNVNLAATDFAVDAVAMTVDLTDATLTEITGAKVTSLSADGNLEFVPGTETITFKVSAADGMVVTVKLGETELAATNGVYSFTPAANAKLTVTAAAAAFQIGDAKYATIDKALAGLKSGDTLKLLGNANAGEDGVAFGEGTYTIDLNGFTLSAAEGVAVIYNEGGAVTIIDSSVTDTDKVGTGKVVGKIENAEGTLAIYAGTYEGTIFTNEEGEEAEFVGTTTIYGGKFAVKVAGATLVDGTWKEDGNYWTIGSATPAPSIDADDGTIAKDGDGDYVVTPAENKTEVEINVGNYTGNVIVPSTVTKITGTIAPAQIGVQLGAYKVIGAFKLNEANEIVLNKDAEVTVGTEKIKVEPELANTAADGTTEIAPFEAGAEPAATIKTIPGLTYSLDFDSDVKGAFGTSAASKTADGNRMTLQDKNTNGATKRFYKIRVRK